LDGVLRDAVCADVFIRTRGAGAGCARSKFTVIFTVIFAVIFIGGGKRAEASSAPTGDGSLATLAVGFITADNFVIADKFAVVGSVRFFGGGYC